jgi:uncharacterized membrane protein YeiB
MTTTTTSEEIVSKTRLDGVDVARGFALLGMMAVHTFSTFTDAGSPTAATVIAGGRSAATFVFVAGVSLAFLSGGRRVPYGPRRTAAAAGIALRAVVIGLLGLTLGYLHGQIDIILPHYALMFLLAIPLLGLSPRILACVAAGLALLGPVLLVSTADGGLAYPRSPNDPDLGTLVHHPFGLLVTLLFTGSYPVVVYLAYLFAGLAAGRLDLSSRRVATRLLAGGLALAITARIASAVLLYPLGGLQRLIALSPRNGNPSAVAEHLLWEPSQGTSWWYLALPSPHANTPLDLLHTLGSAMAVLGVSLLVMRVPVVARALRPLADVGSMTLTLYSAHLVVLASGLLDDNSAVLYLVMVVAATAFAVLWRRRFGQGPLERLVALAAGRARRVVAERLEARAVSRAPDDERGPTFDTGRT